MSVLDSDRAAANRPPPSDYETDLEQNREAQSAFSSTWQTQNLFEQKQLASKVNEEMNELTILLTRSLNIHLNVGQHFTVNSPNVFMSLESLTSDSLSNKQIPTVGNALLRLPSILNISLNHTSSSSLRVCLFRLFSLPDCFVLVHFGIFAVLRSIVNVDDEFISIDFAVIG